MISSQKLIYNTPDGGERDPELIRAEAMTLSTPLSDKYAPDVYDALQEVHATCAADLKTMCAAETYLPNTPPDIDQLMQLVFNPPIAMGPVPRRSNARRLRAAKAKQLKGALKNSPRGQAALHKKGATEGFTDKLRKNKRGTATLMRNSNTKRSGARIIDKFRALYANSPLSKVMYRPKDIIGSTEKGKTAIPMMGKNKMGSTPHSFVMRNDKPLAEHRERSITKKIHANAEELPPIAIPADRDFNVDKDELPAVVFDKKARSLRADSQLTMHRKTVPTDVTKKTIIDIPDDDVPIHIDAEKLPPIAIPAKEEREKTDMPCGGSSWISSDSFFAPMMPMMNFFPFSSLFSSNTIFIDDASTEDTPGITFSMTAPQTENEVTVFIIDEGQPDAKGYLDDVDDYYYGDEYYYDGEYYDDDYYGDYEIEPLVEMEFTGKKPCDGKDKGKAMNRQMSEKNAAVTGRNSHVSGRDMYMMKHMDGESMHHKGGMMMDFFPPPHKERDEFHHDEDHHHHHDEDHHHMDHHDEDHHHHHDEQHGHWPHDEHDSSEHPSHRGPPPRHMPQPSDERDPHAFRDAGTPFVSFFDDDESSDSSSSDSSSSDSLSSDSSSDSSDEGWHPPHRPPPHHHFHPLPQDHYAGNLGFGADADLCMYQNFPKLSDDCQDAVSHLYDVRAEYWEEYNDNQHHPPSPFFCFLIIIGAVLLFLGVLKRCCMHKKRKQIVQFLDKLNANPKLKAHVETEMGQAVPPPIPNCCGKLRAARAVVSSTTSSGWGGFCLRMTKAIIFLGAVFVSSLFISITSLEMTAAIIDHMDANAPVDEDTGEARLVSPFFALFILFSVCAVQLLFLGIIVRAVKTCVSRHQEHHGVPVAAAAVTTGSQPASPTNGNGGFGRAWRNVMLMPRNLPAVGSIFRRSYQPLSSADDDQMVLMQTPTAPLLSSNEVNTEMVSLPARSQVAVHQPQQMAVIVPAAPVTSVNMV